MGVNGKAASGAIKELQEFWKEKFSFLDDYARFTRDRLPNWSTSDVQEFISSDPVQGPTLTITRKAANFGLVGVSLEQFQQPLLPGNTQRVPMVRCLLWEQELYLVGHLGWKLGVTGTKLTD